MLQYTYISKIYHYMLLSKLATVAIELDYISCLLQSARPYIHFNNSFARQSKIIP